MKGRLVVDVSVAMKWVVEEPGSDEAISLHSRFKLSAPDLLIPECTNILWKKVRRGQLPPEQAVLSARNLTRARVDLIAMIDLQEAATDLALQLNHPAYECFYLALAERLGIPMMTADMKLAGIVADRLGRRGDGLCLPLAGT